MSELERLVHNAENGEDNGAINRELSNISSIQERLETAREMKRINQADRNNDPTLPKLELNLEKDGESGPVHVAQVELQHTTEAMHPTTWLNAFRSTEQLYKLPPEEETRAMRADGFKQGFTKEKRE